MSNKLTPTQEVVLAFYAVHRCGAMRFQGRWLWADEVRSNPDVATQFLKDRAEGYRNSELLRTWLRPPQKGPRQ
jgi:hypothetical protein